MASETIADIVAEKRHRADEIERDVSAKMASGKMGSDQYAREVIADLRNEADRLEAAWEREKADAESDALAVGGIVEAARTTEKSSAVGNAAAMREAWEDVLEKIDRWRTDGVMEHWQYSQLFDIADAALSAPARNCDRFRTKEDARAYFDDFVCLRSNGSGAIECKGCPLDSIDNPHRADCREAWLLASAAERKGEGDGSK